VSIMHQQSTVSFSQTQSTPYTFTTGELDSLRGKLQTAEEQMSAFNSKNAQYIMQLSLNETRTLQKMIDMTYLQGLRLQTPSSSGVFPSMQNEQEMRWSNGTKSGGNTGTPPSDYVCHKCGVEGHYVHDCPNVIGKGSPPGNYVCRKCNIQGHWIEECPLGNQQDNNKPPPPGYCCYRCGVPGHWIKNCRSTENRSDNPKERERERGGGGGRGRGRGRDGDRDRDRDRDTSNYQYPQKMSDQRSTTFNYNSDFSNDRGFNSQPDLNQNQNLTYVKKARNFNKM